MLRYGKDCYKNLSLHSRGGGGGGGVRPEKLGGGVRPASQNPYPIYAQNLRNSLPHLTWRLNQTLFQSCVIISSLVPTRP